MKEHWQKVYMTKEAQRVSWFTPRLERSLEYIGRYAAAPDPVLDVGGGASTLPDDLLAAGFQDISVLDISAEALAVSQKRLGSAAAGICWIAGDVTKAELPAGRYAIWHDRAVFHFLVNRDDRQAYVDRMKRALRPGGTVIMAVFGPQGPKMCSDLPTERYSAEELAAALGAGFVPLESELVWHDTPFDTRQQFLYACFRYSA